MKNERRVKFVFIVLSFLIPLSVFEIYLRAKGINATYIEQIGRGSYQSAFNVDKRLGWYNLYAPGAVFSQTSKEFTTGVNANKVGCNDYEWELQKNKKRIFCIGDSFTEGIGASRDSSYPAILRTLIKDTAEVCNAGVSGGDPFFSYTNLKFKLLKYRPDIILVTVNETDIMDYLIRGGFSRFQPDGTMCYRKPPWWEFAYARLYTVRYLVHNVLDYNMLFYRKSEMQEKEDQAKAEIKLCVDSIATLCSAEKITPVFIFNPMQIEVKEQRLKCQSILTYCNKQHYRTVDLLEYYKQNGINANTLYNYWWPVDGHHNATGYAVWARAAQGAVAVLIYP